MAQHLPCVLLGWHACGAIACAYLLTLSACKRLSLVFFKVDFQLATVGSAHSFQMEQFAHFSKSIHLLLL